MMDQKIKKKWVRALRSGKYKQARRVLLRSKTGGMCCLGVLAKIQGCPTLSMKDLNATEPTSSVDYSAGLSPAEKFSLAVRNDGEEGHKRHSFKQIADYIEKNF